MLPEGAGGATAWPGAMRDFAKGVSNQLLRGVHASSSIKVAHHIQGGIARVVEALPEVMQYLPVHTLHLQHTKEQNTDAWEECMVPNFYTQLLGFLAGCVERAAAHGPCHPRACEHMLPVQKLLFACRRMARAVCCSPFYAASQEAEARHQTSSQGYINHEKSRGL